MAQYTFQLLWSPACQKFLSLVNLAEGSFDRQDRYNGLQLEFCVTFSFKFHSALKYCIALHKESQLYAVVSFQSFGSGNVAVDKVSPKRFLQ